MSAKPMGDTRILGAPGVDGKATVVPSHEAIDSLADEKHHLAVSNEEFTKEGVLEPEVKADLSSSHSSESDEDIIIITGADAAAHLLPVRDDFEPALTFRCIFLATILSAFQAVVYQIYQVCWRILTSVTHEP